MAVGQLYSLPDYKNMARQYQQGAAATLGGMGQARTTTEKTKPPPKTAGGYAENAIGGMKTGAAIGEMSQKTGMVGGEFLGKYGGWLGAVGGILAYAGS